MNDRNKRLLCTCSCNHFYVQRAEVSSLLNCWMNKWNLLNSVLNAVGELYEEMNELFFHVAGSGWLERNMKIWRLTHRNEEKQTSRKRAQFQTARLPNGRSWCGIKYQRSFSFGYFFVFFSFPLFSYLFFYFPFFCFCYSSLQILSIFTPFWVVP